jgi:hypothetical protein
VTITEWGQICRTGRTVALLLRCSCCERCQRHSRDFKWRVAGLIRRGSEPEQSSEMIKYILKVLDEENPVKEEEKRLALVTCKCQGSAKPKDQAVDGKMALVLRIGGGAWKKYSHVPIGFGGELSAHSQR